MRTTLNSSLKPKFTIVDILLIIILTIISFILWQIIVSEGNIIFGFFFGGIDSPHPYAPNTTTTLIVTILRVILRAIIGSFPASILIYLKYKKKIAFSQLYKLIATLGLAMSFAIYIIFVIGSKSLTPGIIQIDLNYFQNKAIEKKQTSYPKTIIPLLPTYFPIGINNHPDSGYSTITANGVEVSYSCSKPELPTPNLSGIFYQQFPLSSSASFTLDDAWKEDQSLYPDSKEIIQLKNTQALYFTHAKYKTIDFFTSDSRIQITLNVCPISNPKQELIKIANSLMPYTK